jgi:outer membrane protein assembly factor BamD
MKNKAKITNIFLAFSAAFLMSAMISGCKSSIPPEELSAEKLYEKSLVLIEDEDYLEAKKLLEVLKLQYPASQYADDAQYHLADLHFLREEYILAAYHFNTLRKVYPSSKYIKRSMYKAALCLYHSTLSFDRDQEYTFKAIKGFTEYQTIYPERDSLYNKASVYIDELRNKLAHKDYFTAELYRKMDYPQSSIIYYDSVIDNYADTDYYERAYLGKIETLVFMRRYKEAETLIKLYREQFPAGQFADDIAELESEIRSVKME